MKSESTPLRSLDQSRTNIPYSGTDNLEVMKEAVNYNRYLLALIQEHAGNAKSVIDFGAGSGTFAAPTARSGLQLTAVELDDRLREHLAGLGLSAVATSAKLPTAAFDYAYTLNVLEHITDDVAALQELRRTLKPGARLLVYVPAFAVLYTSMDAKVGHVRRYRRDSLARSVTSAGFMIERMEYADSIGFIATLIFRWLDPGTGDINHGLLKAYDRFVFPLSRSLDRLTHRWFGKNLVLVAINPPSKEGD